MTKSTTIKRVGRRPARRSTRFSRIQPRQGSTWRCASSRTTSPPPGCNDDDCDENACAQELVPIGPLTADPAPTDAQEQALVAAVNAATPGGNGQGGGTPTFAALSGAEQWATAHQAANPNERTVVVFVTDGQPNGCNEDTSRHRRSRRGRADLFGRADVRDRDLGGSGRRHHGSDRGSGRHQSSDHDRGRQRAELAAHRAPEHSRPGAELQLRHAAADAIPASRSIRTGSTSTTRRAEAAARRWSAASTAPPTAAPPAAGTTTIRPRRRRSSCALRRVRSSRPTRIPQIQVVLGCARQPPPADCSPRSARFVGSRVGSAFRRRTVRCLRREHQTARFVTGETSTVARQIAPRLSGRLGMPAESAQRPEALDPCAFGQGRARMTPQKLVQEPHRAARDRLCYEQRAPLASSRSAGRARRNRRARTRRRSFSRANSSRRAGLGAPAPLGRCASATELARRAGAASLAAGDTHGLGFAAASFELPGTRSERRFSVAHLPPVRPAARSLRRLRPRVAASKDDQVSPPESTCSPRAVRTSTEPRETPTRVTARICSRTRHLHAEPRAAHPDLGMRGLHHERAARARAWEPPARRARTRASSRCSRGSVRTRVIRVEGSNLCARATDQDQARRRIRRGGDLITSHGAGAAVACPDRLVLAA